MFLLDDAHDSDVYSSQSNDDNREGFDVGLPSANLATIKSGLRGRRGTMAATTTTSKRSASTMSSTSSGSRALGASAASPAFAVVLLCFAACRDVEVESPPEEGAEYAADPCVELPESECILAFHPAPYGDCRPIYTGVCDSYAYFGCFSYESICKGTNPNAVCGTKQTCQEFTAVRPDPHGDAECESSVHLCMPLAAN